MYVQLATKYSASIDARAVLKQALRFEDTSVIVTVDDGMIDRFTGNVLRNEMTSCLSPVDFGYAVLATFFNTACK